MIGAWPVIGFMGLDVALIYVAFKLNFRALRLYETVDLTSEALTVTRVQPSGKTQMWSFNPYWVRLKVEERIGRSTELSLASHGKRLVFASFLTDGEREDFAAALGAALVGGEEPASGITHKDERRWRTGHAWLSRSPWLSCRWAWLLRPKEHSWKTYRNQRFGFQLHYPKDLFKPGKPPQDGAGLDFVAKDGAEILAQASFNVEPA